MADDSKAQKNVFISHIHEDDDGLRKTKDLLKKHGMEIRDSSVNSSTPNNAESPDYIKSSILAPKIRWASTLLVYITPETKNSDYVNWEIEYAHANDKRIVGVWAHGCNECEVPEALENLADAVVGWQGQSIIDAIEGRITGWQCPDGTSRTPRAIQRHPC
jgi:hypothetical protein